MPETPRSGRCRDGERRVRPGGLCTHPADNRRWWWWWSGSRAEGRVLGPPPASGDAAAQPGGQGFLVALRAALRRASGKGRHLGSTPPVLCCTRRLKQPLRRHTPGKTRAQAAAAPLCKPFSAGISRPLHGILHGHSGQAGTVPYPGSAGTPPRRWVRSRRGAPRRAVGHPGPGLWRETRPPPVVLPGVGI